jgi:hypothetical protein
MIKKVEVILTGDFNIDKQLLFVAFLSQTDLQGDWRGWEAKLNAEGMISQDLEFAVQFFNGWFGEEVDLILPERRIAEERQLREAQDDIDKADWT